MLRGFPRAFCVLIAAGACVITGQFDPGGIELGDITFDQDLPGGVNTKTARNNTKPYPLTAGTAQPWERGLERRHDLAGQRPITGHEIAIIKTLCREEEWLCDIDRLGKSAASDFVSAGKPSFQPSESDVERRSTFKICSSVA